MLLGIVVGVVGTLVVEALFSFAWMVRMSRYEGR